MKHMACRIQLYNNYHGSKFVGAGDFVIIGVAVETNDVRYRNTIERFGLPWKYHVLDLATSLRFFDSPIAAKYGVKEVPTKFLIDPKGIILGVNLPFDKIQKILSESLVKD